MKNSREKQKTSTTQNKEYNDCVSNLYAGLQKLFHKLKFDEKEKICALMTMTACELARSNCVEEDIDHLMAMIKQGWKDVKDEI